MNYIFPTLNGGNVIQANDTLTEFDVIVDFYNVSTKDAIISVNLTDEVDNQLYRTQLDLNIPALNAGTLISKGNERLSDFEA